MKLSTKGRYGLRALLDLAVHADGSHVSLYNIAERQQISVNYLEQVFSQLRKAGFVRSVKGAQGGYALAMQPQEMTIGAILRVLEGSLHIATEESTGENPLQDCIKKSVWDRINNGIDHVVDSITLGDLVEEYRSGQDYTMFYI